MKLIIGLGNPGEEYKGTRHNVGFELLEQFKTRMSKLECQNLEFEGNRKLLSEVACVDKLVLAKPLAFMNENGRVVSRLVRFYKIDLEDLYIVHDDLDLKLGEYKIQKGKGPREHKGILSVEKELGAKDFWRVRVGVDNRESGERIEGERYVLEKFKSEERVVLEEVMGDIQSELLGQLGLSR